jgi:hypothetical protein
MKKILLLITFFSPFAIYAYNGDIQNFIIEENSICLNAPEEPSRSYISTNSTVSKDAYWYSEITLSFSPTSSNYLKWFLMADSSNLNASSSGYYLLLGGTKRTLSFYCLKSGKSTLVYEDMQMLFGASVNNIKISVNRTSADIWQINYTLNDTISNTFEFFENQINYSFYWGYHCVYTKTRSKAFCFANSKVTGDKQSAARLPKKGELVINEILFNPKDDGVDFLEILNLSDTIFDISFCMLGNRKQTYPLPTFHLYPDSCVAITKDPEILCSQFHCKVPENILKVEKMLPLLNDSGYVRLLADTVLIDTLFYRADMHHVLLDDVEGLSLERSRDGNFTSASTIVRATPGSKNSVVLHDENLDDFSPDFGAEITKQDSLYNFFLDSSVASVYDSEFPQKVILRYRLHKSARITAKIYTLAGYSVWTFLESELLQGEGKFYWDGRSESSSILPVGMYVIVFEIYTEDGNFYIKKLPVALIP